MSDEAMTRAAFFTVTDERYFPGTVALVNSLRLVGHRESIVVLDGGMTAEQRAILGSECVVVPFGEELRTAASPQYYKLVAPAISTAEVVAVIDSDMIVTDHLGDLLSLADSGRVVAFPDPESTRWFAEWAEIFSLGAAPRRQVYVNSGFVVFSRAHHPTLLQEWRDACATIAHMPTIEVGATGPTSQSDQDALNALLMSRLPTSALAMPPAAAEAYPTALRWSVRVRDERTLECWNGADRVRILHAASKPKPWRSWKGIRRTAYVRLMLRLLDGRREDLPVRPPRRLVPAPVRAGGPWPLLRAASMWPPYAADRGVGVRRRLSRVFARFRRSAREGGARPRPTSGRLRVFYTLRSSDLEAARRSVPTSIYYFLRRYDFDESLAEGIDVLQTTPRELPGLLWRGRPSVVQIGEPLWQAAIKHSVLTVAVVRASDLVRRSRTAIVAYAIDNLAPVVPLRGEGVRAGLARRATRLATVFVARNVDRLAYGTEPARELYHQVLGARGDSAEALIEAVPSVCACVARGGAPERERHAVLFLGAFEAHKGFPELLDAWDGVRSLVGDARIHLIGQGSMEARAKEFVAARPEASMSVDPPRDEIHAALRSARAVVLLSQPLPDWREQLGMPLLEGVAHGCTVVTTPETGLAGWFASHGHAVVPVGASRDDVARAVADALTAGPDPEQVLASLPPVDGGLAADSWLFGAPVGAREGD